MNSSDHSSDLHSLCRIARMIQLIHHAGAQTDLIAIRGIACCSCCNDLTLRQFTLNGFIDRFQRIGSTGDAHSGIHISTACQRITDRTADTGRRTAKWLDLCGVIVGLILKQQQPGLFLAIHRYSHSHCTGIDLFRLVELIQHTVLPQILAGQSADIHQVDRFGAAKRFTGGKVFVIGTLKKTIFKLHAVNSGIEGGVTAMIGPVGIDHADLGNCGIPAFRLKIALAESNIIQIHGKAQRLNHFRQVLAIHGQKSLHGCHRFRNRHLHFQSLRHRKACLTAFHRIDHVLADRCDLLSRQCAFQNINSCSTHQRTLTLGEDLDALRSRVCSLVKLTGQRLYRKHHLTLRQLIGDTIHLRFRKNCTNSIGKQILFDLFHIIAVQDTHSSQALDLEKLFDFPQQGICFVGLPRFLLDIYTINHGRSPPYLYAARPR